MVNGARLKILRPKQYQHNIKSHWQAPLVKHLSSFCPDGQRNKHRAFALCCLNAGPASKTVGNIETALGKCTVFAGSANVWRTDSVMIAIITGGKT